MIDATVVTTAAITGAVGLAGPLLQARISRKQQVREGIEVRRRERQKAYQEVLDLVTDFSWDYPTPPGDYDVVAAFNKPFLRAVNRVRLYGSPAAISAIEEAQNGLALFTENDAEAWRIFMKGTDGFFEAAREDVGPRPEDKLPDAPFQPGAGPRV